MNKGSTMVEAETEDNKNKGSTKVEAQGEGEPSVPIFRDIRRYYCEFCGICRSKKTLITTHILSEHQEELKEKEIEGGYRSKEGLKAGRTCDECGATFKKPAHLKQHMQSHSLEIEPFECVKHWIPNKELQNAKAHAS